MTSFLKQNWIPVLFFLVLMLHASFLGLSDDEAYYWVLAQTPSFGYAFHPPAVAWVIAFFQKTLGGILPPSSSGLVRLPAVLGTSLVLALSLNWLKQVLPGRENLTRAAAVLLSFCGYFALCWMIVPDIPLFLGWTLLFVSVWKICFARTTPLTFLFLTVGAATLILSKYSGILAIGSAVISLLLWAKGPSRTKGIVALTLGLTLGLLPILSWNASHEWASLLYQLRDRHSGSEVSFLRFGRFWGAQLVLAGPILVFFTFRVLIAPFEWIRTRVSGAAAVNLYCAAWALPAAAVFLIQPLFSDFKLHWAFVVWWPAALALAAHVNAKSWKWIRIQAVVGMALGFFILVSCHLPVGGWLLKSFKGEGFDPRLDVTNDFYGWNQLRKQLRSDLASLEVVGSRYQTASQAAFSLAGKNLVTFLPRDGKEFDEWPDLQVSLGQGPDWPRLKKSVLFVADNRYDAGPAFPGASCGKVQRIEVRRFDLLAKWIDVWRCDPVL